MKGISIIKLQLVVLACAAQAGGAAYYRRAGVGARRPPALRPGVSLQPRLRPAPAHSPPYYVYRGPPRTRYAVKHMGGSTTRSVWASGPWRTTGAPGAGPVGGPAAGRPSPAEYQLVRAASAPPVVHSDAGAIHTIPAPNLSLAEKPIVVVESSEPPHAPHAHAHVAAQAKPTYEVTEGYVEPAYHMAKIEMPVGFSKTQSAQPAAELQQLVRNGAALQLAAEYGLSAVSLPHGALTQPQPQPQPHHYTLQGFHGFSALPTQQGLITTGGDNAMIPANVLYQSDPLFLQKLQQQLLHRFPALEFVPYAAELVPHNPQSDTSQAQQLFLLENEELKLPSEPFLTSESKNVVQRETQENTLVTLIPQVIEVHNATETIDSPTTEQSRNLTVELIAAESQPVTTTIKYVIESDTEPQTVRITEPQTLQSTTPIYYAQVGQSVGNVIANGFYSAVNDVRAAAALEQVLQDTPQTTKSPENGTTTSPLSADLKQYFVKNELSENKTVTELKPLLGVPFAKPADSVKVAYTLLRTEEKEPKTTREGAVYAGQIVEASISEDHDFNSQKASLANRAPIRLYVTDHDTGQPTPATSTPKVTLVKAKIPPKSKLTFDAKTGEPVLRIYASYMDNPAQKQAVTSKLSLVASRKPAPEGAGGGWKASADKTQGFDGNQLAKFGLKLTSRSDDYTPLFDDYD